MKQLSFLDPIEIPLTQGYVALVDPCDMDLLDYKWYVLIPRSSQTVYAVHTVTRKKKILLHRIILERVLKRPLSDGEETDHVNGSGLDNRRSNLRLATRGQNCRNVSKKKGRSGLRGAQYNCRSEKWISQIRIDGKRCYLGSFDNPRAAHEAYCAAARKLHGEFARIE